VCARPLTTGSFVPYVGAVQCSAVQYDCCCFFFGREEALLLLLLLTCCVVLCCIRVLVLLCWFGVWYGTCLSDEVGGLLLRYCLVIGLGVRTGYQYRMHRTFLLDCEYWYVPVLSINSTVPCLLLYAVHSTSTAPYRTCLQASTTTSTTSAIRCSLRIRC